MHKLGQALIEIEGDTAHSETYAICHHVVASDDEEGARDESDFVMGIRYVDRLERRDGEWRIADRQLLWEWVRTDPLTPLDASWTPGIAGPSDPVMQARRRVRSVD